MKKDLTSLQWGGLRALFGCAAVLWLSAVLPRASAQELFVPNRAGNSVDVYKRTANFNEAPRRTLDAGATGLDHPKIVVVDTVNNELVVLNAGQANAPFITVYERTASGRTAPIRSLAGANTVNKELFVTDPLVEAINVYPRAANGSTTRIRFFSAAGGGPQPCGLYLDLVNNELFVTEPGQFPPHRVSTYSRTATGHPVPIRTLQVNDPGSASAAITTSPAPNAHTTIGLWRGNNSLFFLRNSNSYGFGGVTGHLGFAAPGDLPVAGDWNGDGVTTIGLFRPGTNTFLLRNSNITTTGDPDVTVTHGAPGDIPIAGDRDGSGTTTVGLFRPSPNDVPVAGDWDGNGTATIGLFRPGTGYLLPVEQQRRWSARSRHPLWRRRRSAGGR